MRKSAARDRAIVVDGRGVNPKGFAGAVSHPLSPRPRARAWVIVEVPRHGGAFVVCKTMYECTRTVQDHPHAGCRRTTTRVVARAVILDVDGRTSVRR